MNSFCGRFDDKEFEMAMITYKRSSFVEKWLSECIEGIIENNIVLSIYDSSDDDNTLDVINKYNKEFDDYIKYNRLPIDTTGGYKYIPPILSTKCKFIMIVGDSRCHFINDLSDKVFGIIKDGNFDVISLSYYNEEKYENKVYTNWNSFFYDCFIPVTCCGMTIFKSSVFDHLRTDKTTLCSYDFKYKDKFGFAYMGYYLQSCLEYGKNAIFVKVPWHSLNPSKKIQHWNKKYYECWCDELCEIMDQLPNSFENKDQILKNTWKTMRLDGFDSLYKAKKAGGLTVADYKRMVNKGYLNRVTKKTKRFYYVSKTPLFILRPIYAGYILLRKIYLSFKYKSSS